ncbi:hypothetical protein AB0J74_32210 [Asanoa sp. NPDC049573]|uniref:hypothetical protein n=1 Tax=Asanoa sp. NPDC049573 TaxID=3155396 RepID=UPI0034473C3A
MRGRIMVAAAAVLVLLGGCSIGDIRRPPPSKPVVTTNPPATVAPFEVRHGDVPVPPSYQVQNVEFVNQALGYALFARCGSDGAAPGPAETCTAALVRTDDGGKSWHQIYHPNPDGKGHQLYADRTRLVLHVDPDGYYISRDRGVTYEFSPKINDAVRATMGDEYQVCCDDRAARVVRYGSDGRVRPTGAQPDIPDLRAAASAVHWVFAIGLDRGRPIASVSNDQGATWRQVPVAGGGGQVEAVGVRVDHGGIFAWLIGQTDLVSWPSLWFFDGMGWRPVSADGHPDRYTSSVVLEDASLAVTTPDGPGLVTGGVFQSVDWPIDDCALRLLADGTLVCTAGPVTWLGIGSTTRKWIRVLVGNE